MTDLLVIAGTHSGVGKTSVALGLCRALARRGLHVQPAKVGPDYLDPVHLGEAAGRPCWNLDPWMMGKAYVRSLVASCQADLLLAEGVMGLYDGADATADAGSTAELARLLDAPVWLVVDAGGVARSFAATVHGFCSFPGHPRITGVIANRCGGERHVQMLREALDSVGLPPLVGAIPGGALPTLASRHLGLVAAAGGEAIEAVADAVERHVTLPERGAPLRHEAPPVTAPRQSTPPPTKRQVTLGVAWDAAFSFVYADHWTALAQAGITVRRFSPVSEAELPEVDGLYFPGGYPELHAADLSRNQAMRAAVAAFAASGRPVYAECGGLMYLAKSIELCDGTTLPMAGVLPARSRMRQGRFSLGYAEIELVRATCLGARGDRLRGHEFHYSELVESPAGWEPSYAVSYRRGATKLEGWQRGNVLVSYFHLHLASRARTLAALRAALEANKC